MTRKGKLVTFVLFLVKKLQFIFHQNKANWEISCTENGEKCKILCLFVVICTFTLSSSLLIPFQTFHFMIANVRCSLTVYRPKFDSSKSSDLPALGNSTSYWYDFSFIEVIFSPNKVKPSDIWHKNAVCGAGPFVGHCTICEPSPNFIINKPTGQ